MCISLSYKNDLVITESDLEEATWRCMDTIIGMKKVFLGSGEHSLAKPTAHVLRILVTKPEHKISRLKLLQALYGEADAIDLDRIIDTFNQSGFIDLLNVNGEIWYQLKIEVVNQFKTIVGRQ